MEPTLFADVIKNRRKGRRLTQQQVADMAGVALNVVKAIEAGKSSMRLSSLIRVAELFGLRLDLRER